MIPPPVKKLFHMSKQEVLQVACIPLILMRHLHYKQTYFTAVSVHVRKSST